jgi:hypothetical protein
MCDGHGRLEYAPDVPQWYNLNLTGPAIGKILECEDCDPRSIAELMILASHSDRGRQEALFCVHQLLKCPPRTTCGGKGQINNPSAFLCKNIKNCWRAMGDPYVDEGA